MRALALAPLFLALLSVSAAFDQTPLVADLPRSALMATHSNSIHTAIIYYGEEEHDDACFKVEDDDEESGLLFEDYSFDTLCLRVNEDSNEVYFNAVLLDESEQQLIDLGYYRSSFRVIYDYDLEVLYVSKAVNGDTSTDYEADKTNKISAIYISSLLSVETDFAEAIELNSDVEFESEPFETTWLADQEDYDTTEVTVEAGTSECFTPSYGKLDSIEICVEFNDEGVVSVVADDVEIFTSQESYDYESLEVTYDDLDNVIYIVSGREGDDVVSVLPIQVTYLLNEGLVPTGILGSVTLTVENSLDPYYDCTSFTNTLCEESILYPSVEAICLECEDENCEVTLLLRDDKKEPIYTQFEIDEDTDKYTQSFSIVLDLSTDEFSFEFSTYNDETLDSGDYSFSRFADEIIYWSANTDDLEYARMVGDLSEDYTSTEEYTDIQDSFNVIEEIQFGTEDVTYGIICDSSMCYLGNYADGVISGVKEYEGYFDKLLVFRITEGIDQICVSFYSSETGEEINDCNTEEQWLLYQEYISQYPIFSVDMSSSSSSSTDETEEEEETTTDEE